MKIAIVIGTMGGYGGAERATAYLANGFADKKNEVHLITCYNYHSKDTVYHISDKVDFIRLNQDINVNRIKRFFIGISLVRDKLLEIKPEIVVGITSYYGVLSVLALKNTRIPVIIAERNNPDSLDRLHSFEKAIFRYFYRHKADGAVFQTKDIKRYYYQSDDPKGAVIPNALMTTNLPAPKATLTINNRIVSVGRLTAEKNIPLLIEAFAEVHKKHPEYSLTIYGEGNLRIILESMVKSLGLTEHVFFPGTVSNIFEVYENSQLFVMSSDNEGMPNALIEAMAMGMPVISTDCKGGGAAYLIDNSVNGLLVPNRDRDALAIAINKLIEQPELAWQMSREAIKIREKLDADTICNKWLSFMNEIISRRMQK
ncbi:MAG: glycosyltransferase family 4 protein [Bacillota bacterium]|jgi:glycosyltransferase involved in cell wall biosynthesis